MRIDSASILSSREWIVFHYSIANNSRKESILKCQESKNQPSPYIDSCRIRLRRLRLLLFSNILHKVRSQLSLDEGRTRILREEPVSTHGSMEVHISRYHLKVCSVHLLGSGSAPVLLLGSSLSLSALSVSEQFICSFRDSARPFSPFFFRFLTWKLQPTSSSAGGDGGGGHDRSEGVKTRTYIRQREREE